jgi:hypothetical protein
VVEVSAEAGAQHIAIAVATSDTRGEYWRNFGKLDTDGSEKGDEQTPMNKSKSDGYAPKGHKRR